MEQLPLQREEQRPGRTARSPVATSRTEGACLWSAAGTCYLPARGARPRAPGEAARVPKGSPWLSLLFWGGRGWDTAALHQVPHPQRAPPPRPGAAEVCP